MKHVAPTKLQILNNISFGPASFGSSPLAEIAEKTSGAPLPNAKNVTPANDSGICKFTFKLSSAGDK